MGPSCLLQGEPGLPAYLLTRQCPPTLPQLWLQTRSLPAEGSSSCSTALCLHHPLCAHTQLPLPESGGCPPCPKPSAGVWAARRALSSLSLPAIPSPAAPTWGTVPPQLLPGCQPCVQLPTGTSRVQEAPIGPTWAFGASPQHGTHASPLRVLLGWASGSTPSGGPSFPDPAGCGTLRNS